MSATLRGYSRSDEEGHVLTDRAELAAAFNYQQSPTYELLDTGVFAYLWNLPFPEHDDRRWAGYTFYDPVLLDEHGFGSSDPLNLFPIPTGAQGVGRDFATEGRGVREWSILKPVRRRLPVVQASVNDLVLAAAAANPGNDGVGLGPTDYQGFALVQQYALLGDILWTVSRDAYRHVEELLG